LQPNHLANKIRCEVETLDLIMPFKLDNDFLHVVFLQAP